MSKTTRITYSKTSKDGILISRNHISEKYGTRYDVVLDTINYSYKIRNVTSGRIVKKVKAKPGINYPIHSLKIKIKQDLMKLHVKFGAEVRKSRG